jgi:hypothetical protein
VQSGSTASSKLPIPRLAIGFAQPADTQSLLDLLSLSPQPLRTESSRDIAQTAKPDGSLRHHEKTSAVLAFSRDTSIPFAS